MKRSYGRLTYFTKGELFLWMASVITIIISFFLFSSKNYLSLIASLIGATSLIFCAKGNPAGQLLMIVFSLLYGIISYSYAYYGEMITYLGMTAPMAVFALISWIKNPFNGNKKEVRVNRLKRHEIFLMLLISLFVTLVFGFILKHFNTANLIFSTISVITSFIAVYLTFRRSPLYALAYALNDVVLIVLWILASISDTSYFSVVVCFVIFIFNDLYGFINWKRIEKRQQSICEIPNKY